MEQVVFSQNYKQTEHNAVDTVIHYENIIALTNLLTCAWWMIGLPLNVNKLKSNSELEWWQILGKKHSVSPLKAFFHSKIKDYSSRCSLLIWICQQYVQAGLTSSVIENFIAVKPKSRDTLWYPSRYPSRQEKWKSTCLHTAVMGQGSRGMGKHNKISVIQDNWNLIPYSTLLIAQINALITHYHRTAKSW